jgi:flavin reductase (DIM6/NTAB) family NADH-FMN oxidoreductase RutF
MKKEVPLGKAKWIIEPGCVLLVTSGSMDRANIMTFSWQTPLHSGVPCIVLLTVNPDRYSYDLIQGNKQFVINVPGETLAKQVHGAGSVSGRQVDKFKKFGLTAARAEKVEPPLIEECAAHLECNLTRTVDLGHHHLLIADVVYAAADDRYFDGRWKPERFHTLHYLGGRAYGVMERKLEV